MSAFMEQMVEEVALAWLESIGYTILSGPETAPAGPAAEQDGYSEVLLERRLRQALHRLNRRSRPRRCRKTFAATRGRIVLRSLESSGSGKSDT